MKFSKKWLILPLALLVACSSDETTPVTPGGEGGSGDTPSNPGDNPGGGDAPGGTGVSLPSTANVNIPNEQYPIWKKRWTVTMKQEKEGGSTMNLSLFEDYPNAARVRWDSGDDKCFVTGLTQIDGELFTAAKNSMTGCTVSEGIGYGMLISVFNDDQALFNGLWDYNRAARKGTGTNLMPWKLVSFSKKLDYASALDADLDVATSLVLAHYKWGDAAYLEDAKLIIDDLYTKGINPTSKLLYPGPNWSQKDVYNISYFSPVAFRLFAQVDGAHPWNEVLNAHYEYMQKVQNAGVTKAVFPDWSSGDGAPKDPGNNSITKTTYMLFFQESVRIPWRIAWDYYWFNDDRAKSILKNLSDFIAAKSNNDPAQVPQMAFNYSTGELSGSKTTGEHYLGAFCLSGLGVNSTWADACTGYFNQFPMSTTAGYGGQYFTQILQMMYSSLLNGKFVKPAQI